MSKKLVTNWVAAMAMLAPGAVLGGGYAGYGSWQPAEPVDAVNSTGGGGCPIETPDGLSLMIASGREGGAGQLDIWTLDRDSKHSPWSEPTNIGPGVNTPAREFCPTPVGRFLYFVSDQSSACGGGDNILVSRQSPDGSWRSPRALGCAPKGPNFTGAERSPSLLRTRHGTFLFYSSTGDGGDSDLYVSIRRRNGSFGPGHRIASLSDAGIDEIMPNVRKRRDGRLEMVFSSNRDTWGPWSKMAFGGQDVYIAFARHPLGRWSSPRNLGPNVNSTADDQRATLSADGRRLYFGRSGDVLVSERRGRRH